MDTFPAHIRTDTICGQKRDIVQSVTEHCRSAAKYARNTLSPVGLGESAYLSALLHDFGKFTQRFSGYLWDAYQGKTVKKGAVNHTFAGVQHLFRCYYDHRNAAAEKFACELMGYAIGAHHGLFDLMRNQREYGFPHRLNDQSIGYEEAAKNFLNNCADQEELDARFGAAVGELNVWLSELGRLCMQEPERAGEHMSFYSGMLARLLLSAVIEGDRRDTAAFQKRMEFPAISSDRTELWRECLTFLEQRLDEFSQDQPIQRARRKISDVCKQNANLKSGIYRLNVPTGGGKTLTSLRYALAHSVQHHKQRIFFVIPLLSIIDQNSQVLREFLPRQDIVLEHHSNIVQTEEAGDELDQRELLAENWSSPITITTLVQLLNTLFSGKTTSIRRFHSLCNSVIVFDEVQTVPSHMLTLFNLAVNFLTEFCGTTVVLCSATQPCLESVPHPLAHQPVDLVPYEEKLWAPFRRTQIQDAGAYRMEDIPAFLLDKLAQHRSLLVVCNKKGEAEMLYRELRDKVPHLFHLSTSMCMAHRRKTLEQLELLLSPDSGVEDGILCISTQLIEAGVDISFSCVVRLLAGMDSAVQAAGRCNRHGESRQIAPVYLLRCTDERLTMLKDIQSARDASHALLTEFARDPEAYGQDLASEESIRFYYRYLYQQMPSGSQDFPVPLSDGSRSTLFDLLSQNTREFAAGREYPFFLHQNFQTAGKAFRVFDEKTLDVLVPYDQAAKQLLADLCSARAAYDLEFTEAILKAAKPYTVSLYQWQFDQLNDAHAIYPTAGQTALVLRQEYYDMMTGLLMEPQTGLQTEVSLCDFLI